MDKQGKVYVWKKRDIVDAATQSKQRWNAAHYTQVKISVAPEVASAFKAACAGYGVSMANVLSKHMAEYSDIAGKSKRNPEYATKRQRRAAVKSIMGQLVLIRDAQERCRDNIPENLQDSDIYEVADESVSMLDEAIDLLGSIY